MRAVIRPLLLMSLLVGGCASTPVHTGGISGAVAWHATDFQLTKATVEGQPGQRYAFTLVLSDRGATGVTFTALQRTVSAHNVRTASTERAGRWRLPPNGTLRFPFESATFVVIVHHGKSRAGGLAATDARREGAARAMLRVFERDFDDRDFILVGDFNDNPDDCSLNILETGDPNTPGGPEEIDGPFLSNLTEPLMAAGHVSHGKGPVDIIGE